MMACACAQKAIGPSAKRKQVSSTHAHGEGKLGKGGKGDAWLELRLDEGIGLEPPRPNLAPTPSIADQTRAPGPRAASIGH